MRASIRAPPVGESQTVERPSGGRTEARWPAKRQVPMADPPAAAPAGAAMSGQDALLATKLYLPRQGPGFVPRPRLVDALSQGRARGRVLTCAPAGFGKTSLLADWARSGGRPVAWLGLDGGDNDPARFWALCGRRAGPGHNPGSPGGWARCSGRRPRARLRGW